jgi:hypothetical protein
VSAILSQAGIFKAVPTAWSVKESDGDSQSVALVIEFLITEEWAEGEWASWAEHEEHTIRGYFYIIKRDGTVNTTQVEALAKALGWAGDLRAVEGPPPDRTVQIVVKDEPYLGQSSYKVKWINPEDHKPGLFGSSPEEVGSLQTRFGSLLRAAAAGALKAAAAPSKPSRAGPKARTPAGATPKPAEPQAASAQTPGATPERSDAQFNDDIPF